jgi:hypothetical protein
MGSIVWQEELHTISLLKDGWDGAGSLAPNEEVVENVAEALNQLTIDPLTIDMTPCYNGTVLIEWMNDSELGILEIGASQYGLTMQKQGSDPDFYNGLICELSSLQEIINQ